MDRRCAAVAFVLAGALLATALAGLGPATPANATFGFEQVDLRFEEEDGSPARRAGSHPFAWRTTVLFDREGDQEGGLRSLRIRMPPGLVGTPHLLPRCDRGEFLLQECAGFSAVGVLSLLGATSLTGSPVPFLSQAPVYNLEPVFGNGAEIGSYPEVVGKNLPLTIQVGISPAYPHRLAASLADASQAVAIFGYQLILWGDPADSGHDPFRGSCGAAFELGIEAFEPLSHGSCPPATTTGAPFLTLPPSCEAAGAELEATSWWPSAPPVGVSLPAVLEPTGCAGLPFAPRLSLRPTTTAARAPSGLDFSLEVADESLTTGTGTAAAVLADASLHLPEGMTLNPGAATGLRACTPDDLAREATAGDGCSRAAQIGTATVTTPLFEEPIPGAVFVAEPDDPATTAPGAENPFDSLLALYLVLREPERGVFLSLPVRIDPDPEDGQLTARLDRLPELPLSSLKLRLNAGPRAPLTMPGCGTHAISFSLAPSSGNPPQAGEAGFATTSNCDTGFAPRLAAGTTSNAAGRSATLTLELGNPASAPNLNDLRLAMAPGLAADLSGAATCPEDAVASAACPPASRLGFARIALGAGPEPLWVPGGAEPDSDVFLAGPYRGAPFSLLVSVPGTVGPFDLGRVVLRAPVRVDPHTAQLSVELDGLPQIRDGIPLHYRAIRLVLDRPGFVRNPTSCEPMRIELDATAANGATATAGERFQAADCGALRFRPRLRLRFSGRIGRNGHPRLRASFVPRAGEANLEAAAIDLPAGELLDTRRIRALCRRELPPARCPRASRLGSATIRSPLLREPLRGPIYLRAPGRRYPDLVAEVAGGGVRFVVHGRTGSARGGRLRIRLAGLPDIPLSEAAIFLAGGRRGILVNSASLCGHARRAGATLSAHNGRRATLRPTLRLAGC